MVDLKICCCPPHARTVTGSIDPFNIFVRQQEGYYRP